MNSDKTVFITGASSGIGKETALLLDKNGFKVLATVRKPEDADRLKKASSDRLETMILDVTHKEDIQRVSQQLQVKLSNSGLYGLVNNAGMGEYTPIEVIDAEKLKQVMETNFFGAVSLTQALLPLIRKARGRIVNVSSVGGLITIPYGFALCASKHALEAFSDGLRLELKPQGIRVITINPSAIHTPSADKMLGTIEEIIRTMAPEYKQLYEKTMRSMAQTMSKAELEGVHPDAVAGVIYKALNEAKPKVRYPVGPNARLITALAGILPDELFDKVKLKLVGIKLE